MLFSNLQESFYKIETAETPWAFQPSDFYICALFSALIGIIYASVQSQFRSNKGKAWIIMLISSISLSVFGCKYVYDGFSTMGFNWDLHFLYSEDGVARLVVLFFAASNIMDLLIGFACYPEHMDPFSTTFHHICYIILLSYLLSMHFSRGFCTCFFMELPTSVLSIGSVWPELRDDNLFGILFLISRVGYNIFLLYTLWINDEVRELFVVTTLILFLHLYWFSKWLGKYSGISKKKLAPEKKVVVS